MTSVKLEKPSNTLRSKKAYGVKMSQGIVYVTEYFYMFFSPLKDVIQTKSKTNSWISKSITIICLKRISEECFWLNVNVNARLKFLWRLGVFSESN